MSADREMIADLLSALEYHQEQTRPIAMTRTAIAAAQHHLRSAAPAAPAAEPVCRSDGRCQYAIDSGAEGLGHCPKGKCIMPASPGATPAPAQSREPLTLTDEHIASVAEFAIGYDGDGFQDVHSGDLRHFARAVIAEFCRINGIGSREPLTDEQIAALTIMLDHFAGDPRTQCLRPLVQRGIGSKP